MDHNNITCIRGCYVNEKREIISMFKLPPVSLPPEEGDRYLSLFKKALSGTPDKNLVEIPFANEAVGVSDEHKLLTALRDTAITDDDMAEVFFQRVLAGRAPDYLIVQHMEPDHSANINVFMARYPAARVVASAKAFAMMRQFYGQDYAQRRVVVGEGDILPLGKHTLSFVAAPMVHWPEVIVTYDAVDKILYSADAFGKFGALDVDEPWDDEARRYYIGIVGKYGAQVQALLKKAAALDIAAICPLHGPVLRENLAHYLHLYQCWSGYVPEVSGTVIACASIYGHTWAAAQELTAQLRASGRTVALYDLARCDLPQAVADAFRYDQLVLCSSTYNADVFPCMRAFIEHLAERGYRNRTVALVENGTWAPMAAKVMQRMLESCKGLTYTENTVRILSALNDDSRAQIGVLEQELLVKAN